jgi:hypothetical protein
MCAQRMARTACSVIRPPQFAFGDNERERDHACTRDSGAALARRRRRSQAYADDHGGRRSTSSTLACRVLAVRYRVQVRGVDACLVATQMVDVMTVWDWPDERLVGRPVGKHPRPIGTVDATTDRERSVPGRVDESCPLPAAVRTVIDVCEYPIAQVRWRAVARRARTRAVLTHQQPTHAWMPWPARMRRAIFSCSSAGA